MTDSRGALLLLSLLLSQSVAVGGVARPLTFRLGASIGTDGACAALYQQTAQGYQYFIRWLQSQGPITVSDLRGNNLTVSMQLRLVTHNCTESGRQAALDSLIKGTSSEAPVHLLLGGNGENAAADAEQAEAASRILLHCCTARDSVYTAVNRPHVYGLFTPASQYTGPVLRSMAFAGVSRLAVVFNTASQLHQQLCLGALRQLPQLRQLRPGFAQELLVVNYTALQADTPGFWDDLGNRISGIGADALVACDEMHHTTELVRWLHGHRHRLAAMWLASYGNMSEFLTGLDGQGEYALTTVQWLPSMPYADSYFGTAAQYAADFTDAMGNAPSYFSAAATAAGLVLLTALRQSIEACDVGSLTQGQQLGQDGLEGVDADAFMWGAHGMLCSGPRGVGGNRSGVLGTEQLRYSLDTLSVDTFFGPVEFNAFRQNSIHPALVAQVVGDRLLAVLPVDLAEAPLVMPVPMDPAPNNPWATTPAGIVIITLACCLSVAVAALAAALVCTRRAQHSGRVPQPSIELDLAEIKVELAPSRNVDGTFEPGEGMYRGVRVKLVVATELMSQLGGSAAAPGAGVLAGLPPPQGATSLVPQSPAIPTFVRGQSANIDAVPEDSSVDARGFLRLPPPEVPMSTSPWASTGRMNSVLNPLHQSPTPSGGQRTSDDSSADPLPRRLQPPQRALSGGEQSSATHAQVVQKASSFLSEEGVVLGLTHAASGVGMTPVRTPMGQLGVAASDAHRSSQSGARACALDTETLGELRPVTVSQSGVALPKAQLRQWKARIGALVWRAVRLHHPNICPIMGIVWEWPGLLESGGTVPVVVRCWYGFGNLARLLENETVPLPLLTKATIARGVAEAMVHLHQQNPPIVAGPLDTERIIIDDHFNPHMFLRLTSMDERYGSASAVQSAPNRGSTSRRWDRTVAASVPAVLKRVTKYIPSPSIAGRSPKAEVLPATDPSSLPRGEDPQPGKPLIKQQRSGPLAEGSHMSGLHADPTVHARVGQEEVDANAYTVVVDMCPAVEAGPEDADEIEPEHPSIRLAAAQAAVSASKSTPGIAPIRLLSGLKSVRAGTATGVLASPSPSQLPGSPRISQLLAQPSPCVCSPSGFSQLQQHLQQQQSLGPGGLSVKAGQEYAPSKEQDVYDFGRLLCNIFVMTSDRGSHSTPTPGVTGRLASNAGGGAAGAATPACGGSEAAWARVLASRPASGHLFPMGRSPWEEEAERQAAVDALQESVSEELANLAMACMRTDPAARPTMERVLHVWDTVVFPSLCAAGRAVPTVPLGVELGSPVDSVWQRGAGVWSNEGPRASDSDGRADDARQGAPAGLRRGMQERALLALVVPRSGGSPGGEGDAGVSTAGERNSPIDGWLPWQHAAAAAGGNGAAAARRNSTAVKPVVAKNASFTKLNKRALGHNVTSDDLLFDIFPPKVARALMAGEPVQPERYDCVSIFFSDIVGYTDLCGQLQPHEVMDMVDRLYSLFDALIQSMKLFKVETVGDAYLAVANLRCPQPDSHARLMAQFAFAAVAAANALPVHPERPELGCLHIRVGLHCGPVVASVVGTLNRRYCLFGDAVNTAARMEHNSEADRVHCSGAFAALLAEQWPAAVVASRGVRPIKGKGPMETCWLSPPAGWHPGTLTRGSEDRPAARRRSLAEYQAMEMGV